MNYKRIGRNRILSLVVLGLLLAVAVAATEPAAGQGSAPAEAALRQIVNDHNTNAVITELDIQGTWASGATVEVNGGGYVVGEGTIFVAHWDGNLWAVYWEGTAAFRSTLSHVPDSLLSAERKMELDYENAPADDPEGIQDSGYRLPWPAGTTYYISRAWATGSCDHAGVNAVDIVMPLNSRVVAARAGTVIEVTDYRNYCGCSSSNLNNRIRVQHSDGTIAWYSHIARYSAQVSVGQAVSQGQWIANSHMIGYTCGSTTCGSGTTCPTCKAGAHLHFEVRNSAGTKLYITFDDVGAISGCHSYTSGNTGDTSPPVTYHSLSGNMGENGWYTSPVQVTLVAQDGGGSGVKAISYNVDGGGWQSQSGSSVAFTVSGDGGHTVYYRAEDNVGNQESEKQVSLNIDATPPSNPISVDSGCSAPHDTWQNICSDPNFTWSGAADGTSGVAGYNVYWGTDPNGTSGNWTGVASFDPGAVDDGTYYLRVQVKDNAGNWSGWSTLFILRYDHTAPTVPTSVDPHCSNPCNDPRFTWGGASDASSGVAGYHVYWGPCPVGNCSLPVTDPDYDPPPVSGGTYCLGIQTQDYAGNRSSCETMMNFHTGYWVYMPLVLKWDSGTRPTPRPTTTPRPSPAPTATPMPTLTPTPLPTSTPTPPPVTLVIDDQDAGFTKHYPGNWHGVNAGYNNHAWWTWTTNDPSGSLNWAEWVADIPYAGNYRVEVTYPYAITGYPDTTCARYQVYYSGGSATVTVDQSQNYYPAWTTLGTFYFSQGAGTARIVLSDLTCDKIHDIWFDAVKLVRVP